jgi:hypothetical protein
MQLNFAKKALTTHYFFIFTYFRFRIVKKQTNSVNTSIMAVKLEYIWLDGYKPTQSLRSKTKIEKESAAILKTCQTGLLTAHPLSRHLEDRQTAF